MRTPPFLPHGSRPTGWPQSLTPHTQRTPPPRTHLLLREHVHLGWGSTQPSSLLPDSCSRPLWPAKPRLSSSPGPCMGTGMDVGPEGCGTSAEHPGGAAHRMKVRGRAGSQQAVLCKRVCRSQWSPSTMCDLGTELRLRGLAAGTFPCQGPSCRESAGPRATVVPSGYSESTAEVWTRTRGTGCHS